ncbi:MAG: substrate-binding domain-containing protein [Treponema sp.]|jgi:ribose transport system substrate-binding protein|nr:substrate-binding domain-containing protein [Treponema sp.]
MKKIATVFLVIFIICGPVFAQKSQKAKIGIMAPSAKQGWTAGVGWWTNETVNNLKKIAGDRLDFRVIFSANTAQQLKDLDSLASWGMNFLVLFPFDSAPLTQPVKQLQAKGVRCIVVEQGLTDTYFGYVNVTGDNPGMGRIAGQWLARTMKAEGLSNYVAIGGVQGSIDTQRMSSFFTEMNRDPSLRNLLGGNQYEFGHWVALDAQRVMQGYLSRYPRIEAVFCQEDDMVPGVMQAIREARRADIKIVLGGAGSKVVYKMIMDGNPMVRASALYNPSIMYDGIMYAADVARGLKSDAFHYTPSVTKVVVPPGIVDKNNVRQFYYAKSPY